MSIRSFKQFFAALFGGFFWDTPLISWSDGQFEFQSLLEECHTNRLAQILQYYQPELFQRWYHVVLAAACKAKNEQQSLSTLEKEIEELSSKVSSMEAALDIELPPPPKPESWQILLNMGLSLMLFLGIAEFFGLEVQSITNNQFMQFLLVFSGAVCMNLGEYIGILRMVKAVRRYDPKRSFYDDNRHANSIPFWERIKSGDAAIWLSFAIVLMETAFAAPGLIGLLPPKLSVEPLFQLTVFAAAGLAATINIMIAWGNALLEIQWEQSAEEIRQRHRQAFVSSESDSNFIDEVFIEREMNNYRRELAEAKARLELKNRAVEKQKRQVDDLQERARREFERWEFSVRKWLKENPEVVKNFVELESKPSNNGYHSVKNGLDILSDELK